MVTGPGALAGQRYRLDHLTGAAGAARRYRATDEKLARPVTVWLIEASEHSPEREHLLELARTVARTSVPALLRVLDVVPDASSLAVVLEAAPAAVERSFAGPEVGRAVLRMAEALDAASRSGLRSARLGNDFVHLDRDGDVRLDPIGLFLPAADGAPRPPAALLGALIAAHLDAAARDSAALRLRALVEDWRTLPAADDDLPALIEELQHIVAPADAARGLDAPPPAAAMQVAFVDEEDTLEMEPWAPPPAASPPPPAPPPRVHRAEAAGGATPVGRRAWRLPPMRLNVVVPALAAVLVIMLGTWGLFFADESPTEQAARDRAGAEGEFGPPVEAPRGNRVTVGLAAQEDSSVRVTVDGVVEFDGVLRRGQRQLWEGRQRIQVRTENGQTLLLSVNGEDLGPYSPAMGHPDWNRIDFGFWPGWEQDEVFGRGRRE